MSALAQKMKIVFENFKQKNGHVYIYFQIDMVSYKSWKDLEYKAKFYKYQKAVVFNLVTFIECLYKGQLLTTAYRVNSNTALQTS